MPAGPPRRRRGVSSDGGESDRKGRNCDRVARWLCRSGESRDLTRGKASAQDCGWGTRHRPIGRLESRRPIGTPCGGCCSPSVLDFFRRSKRQHSRGAERSRRGLEMCRGGSTERLPAGKNGRHVTSVSGR